MSKIAWASLLSGPTILGVALYPAAGFAEPLITSDSSLHTEFSSLADSSIQQAIAMPVVVSQQPSEPKTPLPKVQPGIVPTQEEVRNIQEELKETAEEIENAGTPGRTPAFTLFAPSGYGADRNTVFATGVVVANERIDDNVDAALNFGVGLLDSTQSVGLELSYALLSFGTVEGGRNFGDGAFNLKVHRQFPQERLSVAAGYIGFATIGDATDYQNSPYGVVTKFFVLRPDLDKPFSRVAVTAGIGAGEAFQLEDEFFERNSVGPFGSVALRLGRPVSAIAEWGGEDLGLGISYALRLAPNTNFVITPSVRDIVGAGEGPRFIVGTGISYRF